MTANSTPGASFEIAGDQRSIWSSLLQLVVDRNPFYLLSAACMLAGCLALTNSLSWNSLPLQRLLLLIGTINLYEGTLIGLALLLLSRKLLRDGKILLIVEAFFLVDVTFLNAEVVTANLAVGIAVAVILFALALVKLRLVMHALGTELPLAGFVHVMIQIAALLAIPCVLRSVDHGSVAPLKFYLIWWIVGVMPVVGEAARLLLGGSNHPVSGPAAVYVALPWISLITHMGILHYVYDVAFFGAMAAPLLLRFTFILKRVAATPFTPKFQLVAVQAILPLAAILVSLNNPQQLAFSVHLIGISHITTTFLGIAGAYLAYVYCFLLPIAPWCLAAGAVMAGMYLMGPSIAQVQRFAWQGWTWFLDVTDWMVPKTLSAWGVLSVLASFFFLIVGATVSLGARRAIEIVDTAAESPVKIDVLD